MDPFTMVVCIVFVCVAAGVFNNYIKTKAKQPNSNQDESLLVEIDELRERVEILEKIVTDEKFQLEREIQSLGN